PSVELVAGDGEEPVRRLPALAGWARRRSPPPRPPAARPPREPAAPPGHRSPCRAAHDGRRRHEKWHDVGGHGDSFSGDFDGTVIRSEPVMWPQTDDAADPDGIGGVDRYRTGVSG